MHSFQCSGLQDCIYYKWVFIFSLSPNLSLYANIVQVSEGQTEFSTIGKQLTAEQLCQTPVFKETKLHITRKWLFSYLFINNLSKKRQTQLHLLKLGSNNFHALHKDYAILQAYGKLQILWKFSTELVKNSSIVFSLFNWISINSTCFFRYSLPLIWSLHLNYCNNFILSFQQVKTLLFLKGSC